MFLPVGTNAAAQVRFVNFLGSVTAPGVFPREFALLEMIAELSNGHRAGIRCSDIGVDFRDQPHYGAPRGILIRVSLDSADDLLVVKALAVRAGYRPAKLLDFGTSLPIESLHTTMLHTSPPARRLRCRKNLQASSGWAVVEGRSQPSELLCGSNAHSRRR